MRKRYLPHMLALLLVVGGSTAAIIGVPDDCLTVQEGLDSAGIGDTVLVAPGIYYESIVWPNTQGIHLVAQDGPDVTFLDGSQPSPIIPDTNSVVLFSGGLDSTTVLQGFTIREGAGTYDMTWGRLGGGILCIEDASPLVLGNKIVDNSADRGGGVACYINSTPTIRDNRINGNSGGGICCHESSPTIEENNIVGNSADVGGGIACWSSLPAISANKINGNIAEDAGGIYCSNSSPMIVGNTISGNTASYSAGGILAHNSASPVLRFNNIFDNSTFGVCNWDSSLIVDAEHNFWGHASGPFHPTVNPGGLGEEVSDHVDFVPWDPWVGANEGTTLSSPMSGPLDVTPSPIRESAKIRYSLVSPGMVSLRVYNLMGQEVSALFDEMRSAGEHVMHWRPFGLPAGVYFVRLTTPMYTEVERCLLMR
jgi:parallel beta-helix repeat protein